MFVAPTKFAEPQEDSKIYRKEGFDPPLSVLPLETKVEAIKLAK